MDEACIATSRLKHYKRVDPAPTGNIPAGLSMKENTTRKLRTEKRRAKYARRKGMATPQFSQIKHRRSFRQFLLRRMEKIKAVWKLVSATHNLLELFRIGALATN